MWHPEIFCLEGGQRNGWESGVKKRAALRGFSVMTQEEEGMDEGA